MAKQLIKPLAIIIIAAIAGFGGGIAALYYSAGKIPFDIKNSKPPIQLVEHQEIKIQENKAAKDAIQKISGVLVLVKNNSAKTSGTGLVLASDGILVLTYDLFPPGATVEIFVNSQKTAFQVIKRDKAKNLTLVKTESANLTTAGFCQMENLKIGERIILAGTLASGDNFANEGVVRNFNANLISTNILEKSQAQGAAAFDVEGNILGIAAVDKFGWVNLIPIWAIKSFAGL